MWQRKGGEKTAKIFSKFRNSLLLSRLKYVVFFKKVTSTAGPNSTGRIPGAHHGFSNTSPSRV